MAAANPTLSVRRISLTDLTSSANAAGVLAVRLLAQLLLTAVIVGGLIGIYAMQLSFLWH